MKAFVLVCATSLLAAPAFADLHVALKEGRVSIVAKDVTVRQILTEWMRVGQITKIVNLERIPGGPVTLELDNVTETQALDVLLRPLSGYIAAPRPVAAANLSNFDRIILMPTLAAARPAVTASSTPPPRASLQQEIQPVAPAPEPVETAQYEEPPPPDEPMPTSVVMAPGQMNRSPVNAAQHSQETLRPGVLPNGIVPQMPTNLPQAVPPSAAAPFGAVARPGMLVPAAPPGQPPRR
jgi:hypothetical protein